MKVAQKDKDLELEDEKSAISNRESMTRTLSPRRRLAKLWLSSVVTLLLIILTLMAKGCLATNSKVSQHFDKQGLEHVTVGQDAKDGASSTITKNLPGSITSTKRNIYLGILGTLMVTSIVVIVAILVWQHYRVEDQTIKEMVDQSNIDANEFKVETLVEPRRRNPWVSWFLSQHMAIQVLVAFGMIALLRLLVVIGSIGLGVFLAPEALKVTNASVKVDDGSIKLSLNADFGNPLWLQFLHLEALNDTFIKVFMPSLPSNCQPVVTVKIPRFTLGRGISALKFQDENAITIKLADIKLQHVYEDMKLRTNFFKNIADFQFDVETSVNVDAYTNALILPIRLKKQISIPKGETKKSAQNDTGILDYLQFTPLVNDDGTDIKLNVALDLSKTQPSVSFVTSETVPLVSCKLFSEEKKDPMSEAFELNASLEPFSEQPAKQLNLMLKLNLHYEQIINIVKAAIREQDKLMSLKLNIFGKEMGVEEQLEDLIIFGTNLKSSTAQTNEDNVDSVDSQRSVGSQRAKVEFYPGVTDLFELAVDIDTSSKKKDPLAGKKNTFIKLDQIRSNFSTVNIAIQGCSEPNECKDFATASLEPTLSDDRIKLKATANLNDLDALIKTLIKFFIIEKQSFENSFPGNADMPEQNLQGFCKTQELKVNVTSDKLKGLFKFFNFSIDVYKNQLAVNYLDSKRDITNFFDSLALNKSKIKAQSKTEIKDAVQHELDLKLEDANEHLKLTGIMAFDTNFNAYGDYAFVEWPKIEIFTDLSTRETKSDMQLSNSLFKMTIDKGSITYSLNPSIDLMARLHSSDTTKRKESVSLIIGESNQIGFLTNLILSLLSTKSDQEVFISNKQLKSSEKTSVEHSIDIRIKVNEAEIDDKHKLKISIPPREIIINLLNLLEGNQPSEMAQVPMNAEARVPSALRGIVSIVHIDSADIYPACLFEQDNLAQNTDWVINSKLETPEFAAKLKLLIPSPKNKKVLTEASSISLSVPAITESKFSFTSNGMKISKLVTSYQETISRSKYFKQINDEAKVEYGRPAIVMPIKITPKLDLPQNLEDLEASLKSIDVAISDTNLNTYFDRILQTLDGVPLLKLSRLLKPDSKPKALARPVPLERQLVGSAEQEAKNRVKLSLSVDSDNHSFMIEGNLDGKFDGDKGDSPSSLALKQGFLGVKIGNDSDYVQVNVSDLYIPIKPEAESPKMSFSVKFFSNEPKSETIRQKISNFCQNHKPGNTIAIKTSLVSGSYPSEKQRILPNALNFVMDKFKWWSGKRVVDLSKTQANADSKKELNVGEKERSPLLDLLSISKLDFLDAEIRPPFPGIWFEPNKLDHALKDIIHVGVAYSAKLVDMIMPNLEGPLCLITPRSAELISLSLDLKKDIVVSIATLPSGQGLARLKISKFKHQWNFGSGIQQPETPYVIDLNLALDLENKDLIDTFAPITLPTPTAIVHSGFKLVSDTDFLQYFQPFNISFQTEAGSNNLLNSLINGALGQLTLHNIYPKKSGDGESASTTSSNVPAASSGVHLREGNTSTEEQIDLVFRLPKAIRLPLPINLVDAIFALEVNSEGNWHKIMQIDVAKALETIQSNEITVSLLNPQQIGKFLNGLFSGHNAHFKLSLQKLKIPISFDPKISLPEIASRFKESMPQAEIPKVDGGMQTESLPVFLRPMDGSASSLDFAFGFRPSVIDKFTSMKVFLIGAYIKLFTPNIENGEFVTKIYRKQTLVDTWDDAKAEKVIEQLEHTPLQLTGFTRKDGIDTSDVNMGIGLRVVLGILNRINTVNETLKKLKYDEGVLSGIQDNSMTFHAETTKGLSAVIKALMVVPSCLRIDKPSIIMLKLGEKFKLPIPFTNVKIPVSETGQWDPCNTKFVSFKTTNTYDSPKVSAFSSWQCDYNLPSDKNEIILQIVNENNVTKDQLTIKYTMQSDKSQSKNVSLRFASKEMNDLEMSRTFPLAEKATIKMFFSPYEKQLYLYFGDEYINRMPVNLDSSKKYQIMVKGKPLSLKIFKPDASNTKIYYSQNHFNDYNRFYIILRDSNNRRFFSNDLKVRVSKDGVDQTIKDSTTSYNENNWVVMFQSPEFAPGKYTVEISIKENEWTTLEQKLFIPDK